MHMVRLLGYGSSCSCSRIIWDRLPGRANREHGPGIRQHAYL